MSNDTTKSKLLLSNYYYYYYYQKNKEISQVQKDAYKSKIISVFNEKAQRNEPMWKSLTKRGGANEKKRRS